MSCPIRSGKTREVVHLVIRLLDPKLKKQRRIEFSLTSVLERNSTSLMGEKMICRIDANSPIDQLLFNASEEAVAGLPLILIRS